MNASSLERALAESVQSEISHHGGRKVAVKSITAYMAHRDVYSDSFWQAWDETVADLRRLYVAHVGNIRQDDSA